MDVVCLRYPALWVGWALAAAVGAGLCPAAAAELPRWDEAFQPRFTTTRGVALQALALQTDGYVLVAGNFQFVNGTHRPSVTRLDTRGMPDPGFDVGSGVDGVVAALAVQPADGRILLGGRFTQVQGQPRTALARLEPNGRLDTTFAPRLAGNPFPVVKALLIQPDGGILLAGRFQEVEGHPRDGLARLKPDGRLDESFEPGQGLHGGVALDLALDAQGFVLVVGYFSEVDTWPSPGVARLHPDGRVDTSFRGNLLTGGRAGGAYAVASTPDGHVLVAGEFDTVDTLPQTQLARLTPDGRLDETFAFKEGALGGLEAIFDLSVSPQGDVVLTGSFEWVNGLGRNGLAGLRADGTLDNTFDTDLGSPTSGETYGYRLARQPDGALLVVGKFVEAGGAPRHCVARFRPDGTLDESFGGPDLRFETAGRVLALAAAPDGSVLAAGQFEHVNGLPRPGLVRLLPEGQPDPKFQPDLPPDARLYALAWDSAGRWLIAGEFDRVGDQPCQNLARLLPDGQPDPTFTPPGFNRAVRALALPPHGGILAAGTFTRVDPFRRLGMVRLLDDGSVDEAFDVRIESSLDDPDVKALAVDDAGRVWVGGRFHTVNGQPRPFLARLLPDGSLDPNYATDLTWGGEAPAVNSLALTPDGRCVVGGTFERLRDLPRPGLARLRPDGTLDTAFAPALQLRWSGEPSGVYSVVALPDHRVAAAGALADGQNGHPLGLVILDERGQLLHLLNSLPDPESGSAVLTLGAVNVLLAGGALDAGPSAPLAGLGRYLLPPHTREFRVHISREADQVVVDWLDEGRLEHADTPAGPWREIIGTAPYRIPPESDRQFYRLSR